jgi:hypothetical protein
MQVGDMGSWGARRDVTGRAGGTECMYVLVNRYLMAWRTDISLC